MITIGGKSRILLYFDYDKDLIRKVRSIPGAGFNYGTRAWHIALTQANLNRLAVVFLGIANVDLVGLMKGHICRDGLFYIDPFQIPLDERDREWLRKLKDWMTYRRYTQSTIRTYTEILIPNVGYYLSDRQKAGKTGLYRFPVR